MEGETAKSGNWVEQEPIYRQRSRPLRHHLFRALRRKILDLRFRSLTPTAEDLSPGGFSNSRMLESTHERMQSFVLDVEDELFASANASIMSISAASVISTMDICNISNSAQSFSGRN